MQKSPLEMKRDKLIRDLRRISQQFASLAGKSCIGVVHSELTQFFCELEMALRLGSDDGLLPGGICHRMLGASWISRLSGPYTIGCFVDSSWLAAGRFFSPVLFKKAEVVFEKTRTSQAAADNIGSLKEVALLLSKGTAIIARLTATKNMVKRSDALKLMD